MDNLEVLAAIVADESRGTRERLQALKKYDELNNITGASYTEEDLDYFVDSYGDLQDEANFRYDNDYGGDVTIEDEMDYLGDEDSRWDDEESV